MRQPKKTKKSSRNLQKSTKVEAVKTLNIAKVVDASSTSIFNGCSTGTHVPPAK